MPSKSEFLYEVDKLGGTTIQLSDQRGKELIVGWQVEHVFLIRLFSGYRRGKRPENAVRMQLEHLETDRVVIPERYIELTGFWEFKLSTLLQQYRELARFHADALRNHPLCPRCSYGTMRASDKHWHCAAYDCGGTVTDAELKPKSLSDFEAQMRPTH